MPSITTAGAGNWNTGATWTGGVVPASSDTAVINHAVTVDANKTIAGLTINAALAVASAKTLTLAGNCTQANASFTLNDDSSLIFDCTAADRKWLHGTASGQTNCKIVVRGTAGHYGIIDKIGSNSYWFDIGDEGAATIADSGSWDCQYLRLKACGKADHSFGIGTSSFGTINFIFQHCWLDHNEAVLLLNRPYQWSADGGGSFIVTDCLIEWSTLHQGFRFHTGSSAPTGTITFARNVINSPEGVNQAGCISISTHSSIPIDDGIFLGQPDLQGHGPLNRCFVRQSCNGQTLTPATDLTDLYLLADHVDPADRVNGLTNVGNPHWVSYSVPGKTVHGLVMDYPHASHIDGGDGIFGNLGANATVEYCLSLPQLDTDGNGNGSLVSFYSNVTDWSNLRMLHNTVVGKAAQLGFMEVGFSGTKCSQQKSNLISDPAPNPGGGVGVRGAHYLLDINGSTNPADLVNPAGVQYNYIFNPEAYTDPVTGHAHAGYVGKLTSEPDGTNLVDTTSGPDFVDPTRNFAAWAVHKGVALVSDTRRAKLDAGLALLKTDVTLAYTDLMPWVRAGWAPRNAALNNAGHDGLTIGAIAFGGAGGPPPPPPPSGGVVFAGFRQAASVAKR